MPKQTHPINWAKVWKDFEKWCCNQERTHVVVWEEQTDKIQQLVEKELNRGRQKRTE